MAITAGSVVYVKDLVACAQFYSALLTPAGFVAGETDGDFVSLDSETYQLVLLRMPDALAAQVHVDVPPRRREDTPIKPVFIVSSLDDARATVDSSGGAMNPAEGTWPFQDWLVCDGHDPEGNVFQLRQPT